jgi:salicylate hydroxylase
MDDAPFLIAGGGLGGLTLALALARQGQYSIVIEQRTSVEEVGAGIQLSPNVSRLLLSLGLGPALERVAGTPQRLEVHAAGSGNVLGHMELGPNIEERFGAPYLTVHRADLHTILLDAVRASGKTKLAFGRSVSALDQSDPHGVVIRCDSEMTQEHVTGRALIGADGSRSRVAQLLGDSSPLRFRGHMAWRTTIPAEIWPQDVSKEISGLWLGAGAHLVHYPVRKGRLINLVAITADRTNRPGWAYPGDPEIINQRFKTWHSPIRAAIAAAEHWTVWSLFDRGPRQRWSINRATLLGDAAHPVLPYLAQGAALAIEDAIILARLLSRTPDQCARAFQTYETLRKPRTTRVQSEARRNGNIYHLPWPLSDARDYVIRRTQFETRYDWLYGYQADTLDI